MGLTDNLLSGGAGAAIGAALTYAANQRAFRRSLEVEAVDALVGVLADMRAYAIGTPAPWTQDEIANLITDGQTVLFRYRPRIDERHPRFVVHSVRAMAMFEMGRLADPVGSGNFGACLTAYLDAASQAAADFYAKRPIAASRLPSGREILRSVADDPVLLSLRQTVGV